jgi:hypothetical protein
MLIVDSQNNVNLIYCQTSSSVSSRGCMQGIWNNWWTHCLTRESQYQIYANHPTWISLSAAGAAVAFIVMCFLLFLIKNNCGCSIRVYGLYLNEIEKYLRACYNIKFMFIRTSHNARITSQSVFRRGCRDTFIAFNVGCAFPAFVFIGWSYFWLVEV